MRRVLVGLLMLATLLVYAAPSHAGLPAHHQPPAAHEHALDDLHGAVDHDHEQAPCGDLGLADDGACCSVAQCTSMHGGLPAWTVAAFVPAPGRTGHLPSLATPEGIGIDPALRPPCLTI